jgi:Na+-transporting NADH:ubiquinone oxidoreductase subunit NqrA
LLVKPFNADLDHIVPIIDIRSAMKKRNFLGYNEISIIFSLRSGDERELLLYLKRGEEFLNLLKSMMG